VSNEAHSPITAHKREFRKQRGPSGKGGLASSESCLRYIISGKARGLAFTRWISGSKSMEFGKSWGHTRGPSPTPHDNGGWRSRSRITRLELGGLRGGHHPKGQYGGGTSLAAMGIAGIGEAGKGKNPGHAGRRANTPESNEGAG